jgi:hypothetical protein
MSGFFQKEKWRHLALAFGKAVYDWLREHESLHRAIRREGYALEKSVGCRGTRSPQSGRSAEM